MVAEDQTNPIAVAQNAIRNDPTNSQLQIELGMAYFYADRFDEAMQAFQRALDLNPVAAGAYNGIGRIRYHTGPAQAAIEAYQRAIELDPHYIDAYYGLGILHSAKLGDYNAAIEAFQKGLTHNPGEAFLVASLGSTYARAGRFDEAIASLQESLNLQPRNDFAYSWLSIIYLYLKRYDDVIDACQHEIEIAESSSPRRLLGYVYDCLGRYDEALDQLEQSVQLEPDDYEARGALARLYRTVGRQQEADEAYALASELAKQDDAYGQACFAAVSGQLEETLKFLEVALREGQVQAGWVRIDPEFAFVNDDPRFKVLLEDYSGRIN